MVNRKSVLLTLLCLCQYFAFAENSPAKEYRLKAAFLFNFAGFAEWPANAFAAADTPMVIGVLGDNPFDGFLDEAVHGEKVNGHPLAVKFYHSIAEAQSCQILFISASEEEHLEADLADLKGKNILTVSDLADFARRGGIIQMATENNKIRLKVNLNSAKASGVVLSSKLLRPAEIVSGKP